MVWVDAHADINTMTTSNSGNMLRDVRQHHQFKHKHIEIETLRVAFIAINGLRDIEEAAVEALILAMVEAKEEWNILAAGVGEHG